MDTERILATFYPRLPADLMAAACGAAFELSLRVWRLPCVNLIAEGSGCKENK